MEQVVTVLIKGMVCSRCVLTLRQALQDRGVELKAIALGKITVVAGSGFSFAALHDAVSSLGFEILKDKQTKIIEKIKEFVEVYLSTIENKQKFSQLLSDQLHMNYDQLSGTFSSREGVTLEQYIIVQKINRVKHLLSTTDLTITDISFKTNYKSVHHLSRQFKELIGFNPSEYREMEYLKKI